MTLVFFLIRKVRSILVCDTFAVRFRLSVIYETFQVFIRKVELNHFVFVKSWNFLLLFCGIFRPFTFVH